MLQILIFISSVILNVTDLVNAFFNTCVLHFHMCLQMQAEFLLCPILLTDNIHLYG